MTFQRILTTAVLASSLLVTGHALAEQPGLVSTAQQRSAAESILRRHRTANAFLYTSIGVAGVLTAYGQYKSEEAKKGCEDVRNATDKEYCTAQADMAGVGPMLVGGAVLVAGAIGYFVVSPSAAELDTAKKAARIPRANVAVSADPKSKRYGATFQVRF